MKKFFKEFRGFALKGNVLDLAVGVIIGAAFQGLVASLTENIISPLIGLFVRQNFDKLEFEFLGVTLKYGAFLTSVINFFIMALIVFLLIKTINKVFALDSKKDKAEEKTKGCPFCQTKISIKATRCPSCTSQLE